MNFFLKFTFERLGSFGSRSMTGLVSGRSHGYPQDASKHADGPGGHRAPCCGLRASPQRTLAKRPQDPLKELIAKKIIEVAQTGVRDPAQISRLAIKELGSHSRWAARSLMTPTAAGAGVLALPWSTRMVLAHPTAVFARLAFHSASRGAYLGHGRVLTPVVEVTAPDGTKSLGRLSRVSHREALAAVKERFQRSHRRTLTPPPAAQPKGRRSPPGRGLRIDP